MLEASSVSTVPSRDRTMVVSRPAVSGRAFCRGVRLLAKFVASNSSFARMVVPCVVQLRQARPLCPRRMCSFFFFFFFSHLSNAAFVIAWCSGGEKLEPKSIFVFLLLCILICFLSTTFVFALRDLFGAQRTVLCRCSGMLTYVWRKSRCAYLFCIAFL